MTKTLVENIHSVSYLFFFSSFCCDWSASDVTILVCSYRIHICMCGCDRSGMMWRCVHCIHSEIRTSERGAYGLCIERRSLYMRMCLVWTVAIVYINLNWYASHNGIFEWFFIWIFKYTRLSLCSLHTDT